MILFWLDRNSLVIQWSVKDQILYGRVENISFSLLYIHVQILDEAQFSKQYQWQNRSITEWTSQQVARWLMGLNLEHHIPEFTAKNIDGEQLLQLDSAELKVS